MLSCRRRNLAERRCRVQRNLLLLPLRRVRNLVAAYREQLGPRRTMLLARQGLQLRRLLLAGVHLHGTPLRTLPAADWSGGGRCRKMAEYPAAWEGPESGEARVSVCGAQAGGTANPAGATNESSRVASFLPLKRKQHAIFPPGRRRLCTAHQCASPMANRPSWLHQVDGKHSGSQHCNKQ